MGKHILVTHEKGGTAKTTTAVNLAWALAERGFRTLLVDLDTRGDCATSLGLRPESGLFDYLVAGRTPREVVRHTRHDLLDLLPGDVRTQTVHVVHTAENVTAGELAGRLHTLGEGYDAVLYDAAANGGRVRQAALGVAHLVVVPTKTEALGLADVEQVTAAARAWCVLPVMYDRRLSVHRYNLTVMVDRWPQRVLVPVPYRAALVEAASAQRTIFEYAPASDAAKAYAELATVALEVCHGEALC